MGFDPFLYVAFGAGFLAGRLTSRRSPWVGRGAQASVVVLVGLLGGSLKTLPAASLAATVPLAIGFAGLIIGLTALVARVFAVTHPSPREATARLPRTAFVFPAVLLTSLFIGFELGPLLGNGTSAAIEYVLYALLALTAFDLQLSWTALRRAWAPIGSATLAAAVAAVAVTAFTGLDVRAAWATTLGFGFYSLTGPLVATRLGPSLGLLAFLTNFLREDLTMLLAPVFGRRLGGDGVAALGGATSMDTTLLFVVRYGDARAGSSAIATGLVLTAAATVLVPLVLGNGVP